MEPFVINIGRSLGSGGRAIGHILAKEFGIEYYDREILSLLRKRAAFALKYLRRMTRRTASCARWATLSPLLAVARRIIATNFRMKIYFAFKAKPFAKLQPITLASSLAVVPTTYYVTTHVVSTCLSQPTWKTALPTLWSGATVLPRRRKRLLKKAIANVLTFTISIVRAHGAQPALTTCASTLRCLALRWRQPLSKSLFLKN